MLDWTKNVSVLHKCFSAAMALLLMVLHQSGDESQDGTKCCRTIALTEMLIRLL